MPVKGGKIPADQLEAILQSLADAVTVQDPEGKIVYANEAAARMLGAESVEELIATPPAELMERFDSYTDDGAPLESSRLPARRALAGLPAEPLLVRAVDRASGEERWRMVKATPIFGAGDEVRFAVNIVEDVTETKRAEVHHRLLAEAGRALASSIDYQETLQQVAEMVVPQFADWCAVNLPRPDGLIDLVALEHRDPEKVALGRRLRARYPAHVDDPGSGEVLRTGEAQLLQMDEETLAAVAHDPEHLELLRGLGIRSAILAPMMVGRRAIGVLTFVSAESHRSFGDHDLETAMELGRRAATAVENARLYEERSAVARTLERALAPEQTPAVPGWSLADLYRSAGEGTEVGGDFIDTFEVAGAWMLVIGDVAGRGVAAASLTGAARYTLRTAASLSGDPLVAVGELNRTLTERSEISLCTAVVARIEPSGAMRLVCAGHPYPLKVAGGEVTRIRCSGQLLGAWMDGDWEPLELRLEPEEMVILYTDGIIEAGSGADRFGEERLVEALRGTSDPDEAVAAVSRAVAEFTDEPTDDTAMLAVMRAPDRSAARLESLSG